MGQRITAPKRFEPDKVLGCYSQSKAMATQEVLNAIEKRNLNACIVFPSGILGPEDFAMGETSKTLVEIIKGEMPAGIAGSFNLCDVRDLAHGTIMAADKGKQGGKYILGNEPVDFKKFTQMIVAESGCKKIGFFLPLWAANLMAKMMEKQAAKKGTKPTMTTFSVYNLARNNSFDSSLAKKELGYTTRSYEDTIRDEIAWLKATGKIAA